MSTLLQSARAISHTLLSLHQGEITDDVLLGVIEKTKAMNIVEGQMFNEEELFEIVRADSRIGSGAITELYD